MHIFDGYGSELSTVLLVIVVPSLAAGIRWYVKYQKLVDQVTALELKNAELEGIVVARDLIDKLESRIKKLEGKEEYFSEFVAEWRGRESAKRGEDTAGFLRRRKEADDEGR